MSSWRALRVPGTSWEGPLAGRPGTGDPSGGRTGREGLGSDGGFAWTPRGSLNTAQAAVPPPPPRTVHSHPHTHFLLIMPAHTCAHTHAHTHTHTRMHTCVHTHPPTRACTHVCTHACIYTHLHAPTHVHAPPGLSLLTDWRRAQQASPGSPAGSPHSELGPAAPPHTPPHAPRPWAERTHMCVGGEQHLPLDIQRLCLEMNILVGDRPQWGPTRSEPSPGPKTCPRQGRL